MLKQLLKYEFKATKSLYFGLYLALALLSVVLGVSFRQENAWADNTNFGRLEVILMVLYLSVIFAIAVLCFVSTVQRFYKNLLGREGYPMPTRPLHSTQTMLVMSLERMSWVSSASRSWLLSACSTRRPSAWWTGKAGSSCGGCCMGNWARSSGW